MHRAVLGLIVLLAAPFIGAPQARAGLRVCNDTQVRIQVAIGYNDERGRLGRGWYIIDARTCSMVLTGRLNQRYFYLFSNAGSAHPEIKFSGKVPFCIDTQKFILYQAQYGQITPADCSAAGRGWAGFKPIDTGGSADYTQRLYDSRRPIDGVGPAPQPSAANPRPAPAPASGGGSAGSACQRFPNLC